MTDQLSEPESSAWVAPESLAERVERANGLMREAAAVAGFPHPVGAVQWVHVDDVQANDYNPNAVAMHEMRLLHTSIKADGYTQPVVVIRDDEINKWIIVDGFHRYTVMRTQPDIAELTKGYLPVVVIDKPLADRVASTVRHNRARGKHSVAGMGNLVFTMLTEGEDDATICHKLGLEAEELARLKYITGYAKLYSDAQYSPASTTLKQLRIRQKYAEEHPEEIMPGPAI